MGKVEDLRNMAIIDLVTLVTRKVKRRALREGFFLDNKEILDTLSSKMNVSVFQAIILSIMLDNDDNPLYVKETTFAINTELLGSEA